MDVNTLAKGDEAIHGVSWYIVGEDPKRVSTLHQEPRIQTKRRVVQASV